MVSQNPVVEESVMEETVQAETGMEGIQDSAQALMSLDESSSSTEDDQSCNEQGMMLLCNAFCVMDCAFVLWNSLDSVYF